jgi:1-acyl-sn-glycerol-3-phosphate acyltransferase
MSHPTRATAPEHLRLPRTVGVPYPPTRGLGPLYRFGRFLLSGRYDIHIHHAERIPSTGPVLITSNHVGVLDGPTLAAYSPRVVHALVKREMFDGRLGPFLARTGQISIERELVDPFAVKRALRVLRDGGVVAIYPEGSRGGGEVAHSRLGAAYLALCTGAAVVPLASLGTRMAGASVSALPPRGSRIDLVFGEASAVGRVDWPRRKSVVAPLAEEIRVRLAEHVRDACALTGQRLPGPAPDEVEDIAGRQGLEVGPDADELPR